MSSNIIKTQSKIHFETCAQFMAASDPWITLQMDYQQCLQAFEGDFREVYILIEEEAVQGFIIIQPKGTFKGYIQTICVNPNARGKGYGTSLLKHAEAIISNYSPNVFICVSDFNTGALTLYLKFGFEEVGVLKDFVKMGFNEKLLRKTTGPIVGYLAKKI
jgi:ribosomal protein S18 acetylase RimI-like enzyme